jgi:hypothetical protein
VLRSALAVGAVAAVVVAAVVHAVTRGGGSEPQAPERAAAERIDGPDVPVAGALEGVLVFADADCRLRRFQLETLELATAEADACRFTLSPDGNSGVVVAGGASPARLITPAATVSAPLGTVVGDPAWSRDGALVAWCGGDGATTRVRDLVRSTLREVRGCRPSFTPDGRVLTRTADELLLDGRRFLGDDELRRGLRGRPDAVSLLGHDAGPDGLVAVVVASRRLEREVVELAQPGPFGAVPGQSLVSGAGSDEFEVLPTGRTGQVEIRRPGGRPAVVLELWRDGELVGARSLRALAFPFGDAGFGAVVRFSPRGDELAVGSAGPGAPLMLLDAATLAPRLRPVVQNGFAWSPDGAWFALAASDGLRISGALRSQPAYVLPFDATDVAWR